jgi:hypothetical protein
MASTVFTGWRKVTPGKCYHCGSSDDWECDGRGTVYCSCQRCSYCELWDGHRTACPALEDECPTSRSRLNEL